MAGIRREVIDALDRGRPVLIAGPTASGKSGLALDIAERLGGPVVNADAMQVFNDWRILTARPSPEDTARHPHELYGHVPGCVPYSVGAWLADVRAFLDGPPPVIVGGTGLYFAALTEGLAEIPPTPPEVRDEAMARIEMEGAAALVTELDGETARRIDTLNPMRVQRAWEVLKATGRGLAAWQDNTGPAPLALAEAQAIVLDAPKEWLNPRIERRIDIMLAGGALDEARRNAEGWSPDRPSAKAIGAAELVAHVRGDMSLDEARSTMAVQTRQYAKRQRSWFRSRMKDWHWIEAARL